MIISIQHPQSQPSNQSGLYRHNCKQLFFLISWTKNKPLVQLKHPELQTKKFCLCLPPSLSVNQVQANIVPSTHLKGMKLQLGHPFAAINQLKSLNEIYHVTFLVPDGFNIYMCNKDIYIRFLFYSFFQNYQDSKFSQINRAKKTPFLGFSLGLDSY